jgi:hypothetical protein
LALSLLLLLSACGAQGDAGSGSDASSASTSSSAGEPTPDASTPTQEPAPEDSAASDPSAQPEETPAEDASNGPEVDAGDWRACYRDVLNGLYQEKGQRTQREDYLPYSGVYYAQLLDMDGDGVRELIVLADLTLQIYTVQSGQAVLLAELPVGSRLGQTDVSYSFVINSCSDQASVITYDSQNEWTEEVVRVTTVNNGKVSETVFRAEAPEETDLPVWESLTEFYIDEVAVTQETYETKLGQAIDGSIEMDANWGMYPADAAQLELVEQALTATDADYLLPNSDCTYLTASDLAGMSAEQLRLARNEIYARHGRSFSDESLGAYFGEKSWYVAEYTPEDFDENGDVLLNRYEVANLQLIRQLEKQAS